MLHQIFHLKAFLSITQKSSISLLQKSGNVHINNCTFTHKSDHRGYGTALCYSDNHTTKKVAIQNNIFTSNKGSTIVCIGISGNSIPSEVYLQDNEFVKTMVT